MKPRVAAIFALIALCAVAVPLARTAPQPADIPVDWELDFKFKDIQAVRLQVPGEKSPRTFWFLTYTVTNRTGQEQVFIPEFSLYTRTGELIPAGRNVPEFVFNSLRQMLNNPLLKDIASMSGKILQGEDNAKDGVAVWPDFDPQAGTIDIFIGGLSGETKEIPLPTPVKVQRPDNSGKLVDAVKTSLVLSKTLQLTYQVPGEAQNRPRAAVRLVEKKWIMR